MAASLPILTFHSVDDAESVISFPPQVFRDGIAKLCSNGYRTITLAQAVDRLRHGLPFPDRSVVITFDDGYRSVYDEALPILRAHGMSATIFLTVGEGPNTERLPSFGGRSMLAWREIRDMSRCGIDFGAHTKTHPNLKRLSLDQAEIEIRLSKTMIEDILGEPVTSFAYPYGEHDPRVYEVVRNNFSCACSDELGLMHASSDLHLLQRVDAYYLRTHRTWDVMLSPWFSWYLGTRGVARRLRRVTRRYA